MTFRDTELHNSAIRRNWCHCQLERKINRTSEKNIPMKDRATHAILRGPISNSFLIELPNCDSTLLNFFPKWVISFNFLKE